MRPTLAAVLLASGALALPVVVRADDSTSGEVTLGAQQTSVNTDSSKFEEYRDVPDGFVMPSFDFAGNKGDLRWNFKGWNVRQLDERYNLRLGNDSFRIYGEFNRIPHAFGNDGHTLLENTSPGVWQMSDTLQKNFQDAITAAPRTAVTFAFLNKLVAPSLAAANSVDLRLDRQRSNIGVRLTPGDKALTVNLDYFHELRTGDRAASGTSFGFGNVVELPEPLHYVTQDVGARLEYKAKWGVAHAAFHYNWFNDQLLTLTFDNPFRYTDSTDASAYTGPAAGSIAGPATGRMALPPNNRAWTVTGGATWKLPKDSRLSADLTYGDWAQNTTPFVAYTSNTAINATSNPAAPFNASDPSVLPAQHLDGSFKTTAFSATFSSHPAQHVTVTARYRLYDTTNDTPRLTFPGYVRFDAVWEALGRISVPYDYKNNRFDATVAYDFGPATLEGGYRFTSFDHSFREVDSNSENAGTLALNARAGSWGLLRASYEHGVRGYSGLDIGRSEDASFTTPQIPTNLLAVPASGGGSALQAVYDSLGCGAAPCNLRYDEAHKKFDRVGVTGQVSPGSGKATLSVSYFHTKDNFDQTVYGLVNASYDTYSGDFDWTVAERVNVYAYYTHDKNFNFQRGRQSATNLSTSALDDWTSTVDDRTDSIGAGGQITLKPEAWFLDIYGQYQKVNGNNAIFSAPGGGPYLARVTLGGVQSLPLYDDTKITTVKAELRYQWTKAWTFGLGGWYEKYQIADSNTSGLTNYVPGSFFLAANDGDYRGTVGYVRATYTW